MWKAEKDKNKIKEFLNLVENEKYDLRKYSEPVLVYRIDENKMVLYSLWENEHISRFGLQNVDGWDFEEDVYFCPDWVAGEEEDADDWDDDED